MKIFGARDDFARNDLIATRANNWQNLSQIIATQYQDRFDSLRNTVNRSAILVASVAFIFPILFSIANNGLASKILATISGGLLLIAVFCSLASIFIKTSATLDQKQMMSVLNSEDACNMSEEIFWRWMAGTYSEGLSMIDKTLRIVERWHKIAAFVFLSAVILILVTLWL